LIGFNRAACLGRQISFVGRLIWVNDGWPDAFRVFLCDSPRAVSMRWAELLQCGDRMPESRKKPGNPPKNRGRAA
jgi:hypothetical protein